MKRYFKSMLALSAALLLAVGCYPDVYSPVQGGEPKASDFDVEINVDQETNYVTFTMKNKGVVPLWIFGEEKLDGKANKKYAYTDNGLSLRFRDAGEHAVEVKAYNANGVSQGSRVFTFTLENTYRDPFDASPYIKAISNTWVWNHDVNGHFGCGSEPANPTNWWSCGANEKSGTGMYDDEMTFTADGTYIFDPVDGTTYVNKAVSKFPESAGATEDYTVAISRYESRYSFESSWNDAGIEEIYLVLEEGKNLSYISSDEALAEPRWLVADANPGSMRKELKLVITHINGAPDQFISWYYNFITKDANDSKPAVLDLSSGKADLKVKQGGTIEGKDINFSQYWIDPDFFTYVDYNHLTFNAIDGDYRFEIKNGMILVRPLSDGNLATWDNGQALWVIGDGGGKPDVNHLIGWNTGDAPLPCAQVEFDKYQITLFMKAEGGSVKLFGQSDWGVEWTKDKYGEIKGNGLFDIPDADGNIHTASANEKNAGYYRFTFINKGGVLDMDVEAVEVIQPEPDGPQTQVVWADEASEANLLNAGKLELASCYWATDGWAQLADPEVEVNGRTVKVTVGNANGNSQWQGQVHLNTSVKIEEGKAYDFKIVLNSTQDNLGVTVKPHPAGDDGKFFSEARHDVMAYEDKVVTYENFVSNFTTDNLVITLDFPGSAAGTVIEVKTIIIQEHNETVIGAGTDWVDTNSAGNLLNAGKLELASCYWATDGWAQLADPEVEVNGRTVKVTVGNANGNSQWQGQVHLNTSVKIEEGKAYDFKIVLNSTQDNLGVTVKPHPAGDDGKFFSEARHDVMAYEDKVVTYENFVSNFTTDNLVITLDFPGSAAGTVIQVKDIIIQEHK